MNVPANRAADDCCRSVRKGLSGTRGRRAIQDGVIAMGRFGSTATAMAMCLFGGFVQAQSPSSTSQEVQVLQRQAEDDASLIIHAGDGPERGQTGSEQGAEQQPAHTPDPVWFYGAFLDSAYLLDFNHPANDLFRSRGTTYKVDFPL